MALTQGAPFGGAAEGTWLPAWPGGPGAAAGGMSGRPSGVPDFGPPGHAGLLGAGGDPSGLPRLGPLDAPDPVDGGPLATVVRLVRGAALAGGLQGAGAQAGRALPGPRGLAGTFHGRGPALFGPVPGLLLALAAAVGPARRGHR